MSGMAGRETAPEPAGAGEPGAGVMEWVVSKNNFFETDTGKNIAEFYREKIIGPYSDDPDAEYHAWVDSFDMVHVKVYLDEERVCFEFLTEYGRLQDEHCEDVLSEILPEIVADMNSIIEGKPRHSWTPWRPEVEEA